MEAVVTLQDRRLPRPASPAGYSFLIKQLGLELPLPYELHAVAEKGVREKADG